jgi:CBS domain-containing protein
MRDAGVHHLVVLDGDHVRGVVSDRDIYAGASTAGGLSVNPAVEVQAVMVELQRFVTDESTLREALDILATSGASAVPVVGEQGLTGIVTETDLVRALRLLVGEESRAAPGQRATVVFSNPLVQEAMKILADAGI